MAVLGGHPKFRAYDLSGAPLVGGKVTTYEPGTTTPKATYTDSSEGTANTNPVILDSRGEADIWWAGKYKVVLSDSSDNEIWTVDNVDPQTLDLTNGIIDANGNVLVSFGSTGSAVNNVQITNQSTGNSPTISAVGDDTDIDLTLAAKGSGNIVFSSSLTFSDFIDIAGTASNAAYIRLGEDTSNGTNTLSVGAGQNMSTDRSIDLPAGSPTADYVVKTDANGVWSYDDVDNLVSAAGDTIAGAIEIAVQSEMEAASSTTLAVTPGRVKYSPGVAKAWIYFDGTGTPTDNASENVTSITDNGTGDFTLNWTTNFSSTSYCVVGTASDAASGATVCIESAGLAAASARISVIDMSEDSETKVDDDIICVVAFGDQ